MRGPGAGGIGVEGVTGALPVARDICVTLDHRATAPASFSPSPNHRRKKKKIKSKKSKQELQRGAERRRGTEDCAARTFQTCHN